VFVLGIVWEIMFDVLLLFSPTVSGRMKRYRSSPGTSPRSSRSSSQSVGAQAGAQGQAEGPRPRRGLAGAR